MVDAYIMAKVDPGSEYAVRDEIAKLRHVGKVSIVYGDIDLIIEVDVKNLIELRELNERIRHIKGVAKTVTYLVSREP